ncbi:histidine phosphatase family protein [Sphingomonas prati]|uniref:Broad specificity phosphatase PhoE n=1 Tax=Sphingomonas prati TaxID=1843237 RepID=A0A7W9BQF9_9SPHN|nr:histidine phosphatase family protein [Sphingomonas prati]MBB5728066.1 broad specificity phosphatase PhoE [Sphingomonas prati]GGE82986.1 phosphoglycerate mutase [Sphingomonas prati]
MSGTVLLVRHPPVARAWVGRCYGRSDMGWSRAGALLARGLVEDLSARRPDVVVHSGAVRTRRLAERAAGRVGCSVLGDARWLERDFGSWEGRRWDAIWRETGDLMDRIMTDPTGFRPGGGETGLDLSLRALAAWEALPRAGVVLVVAHGGPIAALRAAWAGAPLERMIEFVPGLGEVLEVAR